MSTTEFGVNNPLSNEGWESTLYAEVIEETFVKKFVGPGSDAMIQEKEDLSSKPGSKVTIGLRGILTGDGKQGNEVLEGDEESIATFDDALFIDELRHATSVPGGGTIDAQRVPYALREVGYDAMKQWYAERYDESFFNQICGFTPAMGAAQSNTKRTGLQSVIAPSTNNIIRPNNRANDQSLVAGDEITLTLVDALRERASTMRQRFDQPIIRPFKINGEDYYVLFVHDNQQTDLRRDAGNGGWLQIQRDALQGGAISGNPIFEGALGVYNNVILHKATRITEGVQSADPTTAVPNTRRAVLCGAQSAWMSWGQMYGESSFSWVEELTDFQKALGIAVSSVWGLKKSVFRGVDFGTILLPTFAAPHDG